MEMLVGRIMKDHDPTTFSAEGGKVVVSSCCHGVTPVLQKGPMCGLVALTMAAQLVNEKKEPLLSSDLSHPEEILKFAMGRGLTKQGEMFSTDAMEDVIVHHLHLRPRTSHVDLPDVLRDLLTAAIASEGSVILIPYDADRNHTPCLAQGHSAHWCLLVGLCIIFDPPQKGEVDILSMIPDFLNSCCPQEGNPAHFVARETDKFMELVKKLDDEAIKKFLDKNQIYVFSRHGKSTHMGLWSLRDLLESNRNLVEVDPRRSNPEEYVIPSGGVREGLKNKIIFISRGCVM